MFKILKNRRGVTLVELLAVVVILGIIAAIAVPTIGGLIKRQEARAAETSFDAIVEAAKSYATSDAVFSLKDLVDGEFVDVKTNVFSFDGTATKTTAEVFIKVSGNNVTFWTSSAGTTATDLYIAVKAGGTFTLVYDVA